MLGASKEQGFDMRVEEKLSGRYRGTKGDPDRMASGLFYSKILTYAGGDKSFHCGSKIWPRPLRALHSWQDRGSLLKSCILTISLP